MHPLGTRHSFDSTSRCHSCSNHQGMNPRCSTVELFKCLTPWTFQGYIFNSAVIHLHEFLAAKDLHTRNLETNRNLRKQKEKLHIKSSTSEDLAGFLMENSPDHVVVCSFLLGSWIPRHFPQERVFFTMSKHKCQAGYIHKSEHDKLLFVHLSHVSPELHEHIGIKQAPGDGDQNCWKFTSFNMCNI